MKEKPKELARIFVRGLFVLPWDVAGSFAKYFLIRLLFKNGKPSRQLLLMTFMSVACLPGPVEVEADKGSKERTKGEVVQ